MFALENIARVKVDSGLTVADIIDNAKLRPFAPSVFKSVVAKLDRDSHRTLRKCVTDINRITRSV